jgi:hypothetical protein
MSADRIPTILYYRQGEVTVTNRYVRVGPDRYEVAELRNLLCARGSMHPGAMVGLLISVAEALLVVPLVLALKVSVLWPLAIVALLVPALVGLVCAHLRPAPYRLLAAYRGQWVIVFTSRDRDEFGRVSRAIGRATQAEKRDRPGPTRATRPA